MNKIKALTRYTLYTLLALCGFVIWYLGTAFVILDLNVLNWQKSTRFLVLLEGAVTSIGLIVVTKINR